MAKESPSRRRQFKVLLCDLPIERRAVTTKMGGRSMPAARGVLMAALAADLLAARVESWVIEAIGEVQESRDRRIIAEVVRRSPPLAEFVYDHRPPHSEPLLWAADALAWLATDQKPSIVKVRNVP